MEPGLTPQDTALLVVDMQNGFCRPDGSFASMTAGRGLSVDMCVDAVPACAELVRVAGAANVPVVFTRFVYHPDYVDGGVLLRKYPAMRDLGSLAAGSWDGDLVDELKPGPDGLVIDKSRYSSFYATRLQPILTSLGIRSLVVCGVTTNVCVESTVRDAAQLDYQTFVVADATGELTIDRHRNALEIMQYGFADVISGADVERAWS